MRAGPGLPLRPLPPALRAWAARLPTQPPSQLLAWLLNRRLLPLLDADRRRELQGAAVEVEVLELGLRVRLQLAAQGFRPAGPGMAPRVRLRARADGLWRLLRGADDADRLFFEGALVMEGDTEFGLLIKNILDAAGPLVAWPARGPRP